MIISSIKTLSSWVLITLSPKYRTIFAVALTLLVFLPHPLRAQEKKAKVQIGKQLRVFAKKVIRKGAVGEFEAVGNVVIINGQDTLYGETAFFDPKTGEFYVKGNVRFVSEKSTLYGSQLNYNINTRTLVMKNARIVSNSFILLAQEIFKRQEDVYVAKEAEYTTCKDCPESWTIYGDEIVIEINQYAKVYHALVKVKGVSIFYLPYIVFPIKDGRETGLLYPNFSARFSEGLALELPWYWAINDSADMTLSPTFWALRGYGGDFEYRQVFAEKSWFQINSRLLQDEIYLPGKFDREKSEESFFRHFTDIETHLQPSHNLAIHFHSAFTRDLDIVRDHPLFVEDRNINLHLPTNLSFDYREDWFNIYLQGEWNRNQLFAAPLSFDDTYVQTIPSVGIALKPFRFWKHDYFLFNNASFYFNTRADVFKQNLFGSGQNPIRNASRVHFNPQINLSIFDNNILRLETELSHEHQSYSFRDKSQDSFQKSATLMRTEFSFGLDKVFGLAYQKEYSVNNLTEKGKKELIRPKDSRLRPLVETKAEESETVGKLEPFEKSFVEDRVVVETNSYRHRQEYKIIHHYLLDDQEKGNDLFRAQIQNVEGRFDYLDAIKRDAFLAGDDLTKVEIPPENTVELQWNNVLIKKSPRKYDFFQDEKYLRDNFQYSRLAYFNVSQGFDLTADDENQRDKLTRLFIETGFIKDTWTFSLQEYYFHQSQNHLFSANLEKRFNIVGLGIQYNYLDAGVTTTKTLATSIALRPTDKIELLYQQDRDFVVDQVVRDMIDINYFPSNECWTLNLNYRRTVVDSRFSFNFDINFGES